MKPTIVVNRCSKCRAIIENGLCSFSCDEDTTHVEHRKTVIRQTFELVKEEEVPGNDRTHAAGN